MMKLLPGERVVAKFDKVTVTNFRVWFRQKRWWKAQLVSIMLEEVASCEIRFRGHPWLMVCSLISLLIGVLVMVENKLDLAEIVAEAIEFLLQEVGEELFKASPLLIISLILMVIYINSRKAVVSPVVQIKFKSHPWLMALSLTFLTVGVLVLTRSKVDVAHLAEIVAKTNGSFSLEAAEIMAEANGSISLETDERLKLTTILVLVSVILALSYIITRDVVIMVATAGTPIIIDTYATGLEEAESLVYEIEQAKNVRYLMYSPRNSTAPQTHIAPAMATQVYSRQ